ncbi:unnamed protein product [Rotaria socialis]|uniref:CCHC-type domain-containing protein n=1 Tax=Rotaria socialis TaxID=392032 RepID=A0A820TUS4_9BILA|nr:unnamed protein product [Rotaria socialis]CAF3362346.1 unnamed protein product [Rotaria socialis]CAF3454650.1 unnamed protein product [Rotaria socialis]CAF3488199.1 unnamed protein product [Rotaria socialis]CAF4348728.1 unnamed protein product [Rotaria socialis]
MTDKQKIRKLTNGLKLSLYQEAIKEAYSTSFDFLTKTQQLENIQKLIELRQTQTTQVSTIMKNDDKLSLPLHSYQSSSQQPNNYTRRPTYYSSSAQNDYSDTTQQSFALPSNPYPSYEHYEGNQNQQYPASQVSQVQQRYNQPHSFTQHQNYSSGKSDIYCYNCGQPEHIARYCQQETATSSAGQQQKYSKKQLQGCRMVILLKQ